MNREELETELNGILNDQANPRWRLYLERDPYTVAHVDKLFQQLYGDQPIETDIVLAPQNIMKKPEES